MHNRVREFRSARGLSQADLAVGLGVSRQTVNSIETGRYLPSLPLAFEVARYFDCAIESVFNPEAFTDPARLRSSDQQRSSDDA